MAPRVRRPVPPNPAAVIACANDAIMTKTLDGVITSWNGGAQRLYGYRADEVVGRHISLLVPPDRRDELDMILERAGRGDQLNPLRTERITKDGRRVRVSLTISPVRDATGELVALSAVARDITELAMAEEALHHTAETLRAIVDASPIGTKILDLDGRVQFWSRAAETMLGWAADEVVGSFPPTVPDDEAERHRHFREEIAAGHTVTALPSSRLRKDGVRIDVLVYGGPRRDGSGRIVGVVEMLADVTESRLLEQQLIQAQKIEGIGRLAGGVAHDFNNVLTAILGHADLLLYDLPEDSPHVFHAESIRGAGQRGAGLTAQLLAFSRRQVLQPRILDLNEEVRASWTLLRPLVGETVDFRIITRPDAGHVRADPTQLQQVILNLVVNARDAMPTGGRLTLETDATDFTEAYAAEHFDVHPGRYAAVVVTDTGIGMDRETRQHIFEPFFTTKPRGEGTGLGLATTYGIVRQSGGHIWLYSEPGLGTTFKIYFPQVTAGGEIVPLVVQPPVAHGTGTVLLVEDEDDVREIERRALERHGYHVHVAVDGDDALRAASALGAEIDVLVTDVVMPGQNGPQIAAALRAQRPDLPVLYLSGYAEEMIQRGEDLPANTGFLGKPFTPDALARRVRDLLVPTGTALSGTGAEGRAAGAPAEAEGSARGSA